MRKWIFSTLVVLMAISCNNKVDDGSKIYYGEKFEENAPITPDELVHVIDSNTSVHDVQVIGTIDESCGSTGCWITLKGGDDKTILVTYKDQAFTTAKKIEGKKVILVGSGNYNEKKDEYEFVATGMILN
jgi:hypothetical protein